MGKINLYCDVDDVLFYSSKLVIKLHNSGTGQNKKWHKLNTWNFSNIFPNIEYSTIEKYFARNDFYFLAERIKDGIETLNSVIKEDFYNVNIVTKGDRCNLGNKTECLMKEIVGNFNMFQLESHQSKKEVDMYGGIQIDDNVYNLRETNASVKILYKIYNKTDYNCVDNNENIYIVHTWEEIVDILNFYKKLGKVIIDEK